MSNDSPKPLGYGHDDKGKAGGQSVPDGQVNVVHSAPIGTVSARLSQNLSRNISTEWPACRS